jgi:segregation and condensation protein B
MIKQLIEAALFCSQEPLDLDKLKRLIHDDSADVKAIVESLQAECADRGVELVKVASGYRYQAKQAYADGMRVLYEKNPPKYSRALLETLALIAYRQPITRGEIEDVRGVAVNANIMKLLQERDWIKVVGQKDVPGKPALFATTKAFLDYFNLKSLSELPPLEELIDLDQAERELAEQLALAMPAQSIDPEHEAPEHTVESNLEADSNSEEASA